MITNLIEEFVHENRVAIIHRWTEKEKLEGFANFLACHKYGMETLRDIKSARKLAMDGFASAGGSE